MNTTEIGGDVIDFSDITDRVEELEVEIEERGPVDEPDELDNEHATLSELLSDTKGCGGDHQWRGDWYPGSMIAESHFEDYARELAEDIGSINRDAPWPQSFIDWEAAAEALKQDYSEIEFGGSTYWYR